MEDSTVLLRRLREAEEVARVTRLRLAKVEENAAIDARAREGQLKRARIMEHQLSEIKKDNDHKSRELEVARARADALQRQLDRERAQRLHDIHAAFRAAGTNAAAVGDLRDLEKTCREQHHDLELLRDRCDALEAAVQAHHRNLAATVADNARQYRENERLATRLLMLETALLAADERTTKLRRLRDDQKTQISRLRTDLVRIARTHSETSTILPTTTTTPKGRVDTPSTLMEAIAASNALAGHAKAFYSDPAHLPDLGVFNRKQMVNE